MGVVGSRVIEIARWWAQASEESRYALIVRAAQEGSPSVEEVTLAAYLAESEQGTVGEG